MNILRAHFGNPMHNTPCARCGHGHAGSDHLDGNPRCGEFVSQWSWERAEFWPCGCPEWVAMPYRCRCGRASLTPLQSWLGGIRACSRSCAEMAVSA